MVHFSVEDSKLVCSFSHRLDSVNCEKWEKHLMEKVRGSKTPVVFDMERVNYIASAFLRICVMVAQEVGEGNLTIVRTNENVRKVFKIAGLDRKIKIK